MSRRFAILFRGRGWAGRETRYSGVLSIMQLKRVEEDREKLQEQNRSAAEKTLEKEPSLQAAVQKMVLLTTEARALKEQYDEKTRKLGQCGATKADNISLWCALCTHVSTTPRYSCDVLIATGHKSPWCHMCLGVSVVQSLGVPFVVHVMYVCCHIFDQ